jgi:glycosyltransferase involved in cell wall biosynthesis
MSLALLEAMAAGLPVVASDIAGNRALVEHNLHGMLAPPGDAETLAAAVLSLVSDPSRGERLGAAARRRVSEQYSLDRMTERHLALFARLKRPTRR